MYWPVRTKHPIVIFLLAEYSHIKCIIFSLHIPFETGLKFCTNNNSESL